MKPLTNKRIAVAGARRFTDLETIIQKQGGTALLRPMMSSSANDRKEVDDAIKQLAEQGADWLFLVTGVGTRALLSKADELNVSDEVHSIFKTAKRAVRGYKTVKALKDINLTPDVLDDDGTVEGLKRQLEPFTFTNQRVAVQLHGERMPELTDWLKSQGASIIEIPLYFYDPPLQEDVQTLLYETLRTEIDAIAFTSNTQVKFFFQGVEALGAISYVQRALNNDVIALSVGTMTTKALKEHGITRIVAPEHERMGAMVVELGKHYQSKEKREKRKEDASAFPVVLTGLERVLVVGGGRVALRKAKALLESNAKPIIVSPELVDELQGLIDDAGLEHHPETYDASFITDADLVIAATNDAEVNAQIAKDAAEVGALCNVVDAPELGTFTTVGSIRRGDVLVTVSSSGQSPALTRSLRAKLDDVLSDDYTVLSEVLSEKRAVLQTLPDALRDDLLNTLTADEVLEQFSQADLETARALLDEHLTTLKATTQ